MEGGIGDSFLYQLGLKPFEFKKIDLNYKENTLRTILTMFFLIFLSLQSKNISLIKSSYPECYCSAPNN
jgi:hypothetical protein